MTFFFGTKYFLTGSFTAQELGLTNEKEYNGIIYELREWYLHIFFIPFITLGRRWVIYENAEYHPSKISYTSEAKDMGLKVSYRWYANIGLICLALFILAVYIVEHFNF